MGDNFARLERLDNRDSHFECGITYEQWKGAKFSAAEQQDAGISGLTADPDQIGWPNVVRFAFNLPARGPVNVPTTARIITDGGQSHVAVEFNRLASAPGLQYIIEGSPDLKEWTYVGTTQPGDPVRVTVIDSEAITSSSHRFLRVLIQYAP
jgi:hypothetical protein